MVAITTIKSIGFPTRADPSQIVAKMLLAAEYELPNFYLELILPGDDVLHWEAIIAHAKQNQLPYGAVLGRSPGTPTSIPAIGV